MGQSRSVPQENTQQQIRFSAFYGRHTTFAKWMLKQIGVPIPVVNHYRLVTFPFTVKVGPFDETYIIEKDNDSVIVKGEVKSFQSLTGKGMVFHLSGGDALAMIHGNGFIDCYYIEVELSNTAIDPKTVMKQRFVASF